ncbi:MAG TPA: hypothetical protein VD866_06980 [Urbifossiella sp.]|nr:hypothetical protein [Urbifossiella sp.]
MSSALPPSSAPPGTSAAGQPRAPGTGHGPREIKLVSHSPIFYWWPIWLLGYVMALVTYFEDHRVAILPAAAHVKKIAAAEGDKNDSYELTIPKDKTTRSLETAVKNSIDPTHPDAFRPRMSEKAWMGPLYCCILLLTILITNIPLRGLWSFLVLMLLLIMALGITLIPNGWDNLLGAIGNLHIFINMAGYLFIATTVLILWAVSVFIFDQRTYMIITPGQIRVCEHIGASIRNFDTTGLSFEKQRDDLFRHWILGFFSGDLIVRTSGAEREEIRFPNVLWIGYRLEQVQEILRERSVVSNN